MPKTYAAADQDQRIPFEAAMAKHHPDLADKINVAIVMVTPVLGKDGKPTGPAVTHGGAPAYATVQIVSPKDHSLHPHDVIIRVDEYKFDLMSVESQVALFDHELSHVELVVVDGLLATHDNGRIKLAQRPDDFRLTGFFDVWKRHDKAALEFVAINEVLATADERKAQMTFTFMGDVEPGKDATKKTGKKTGKKLKLAAANS